MAHAIDWKKILILAALLLAPLALTNCGSAASNSASSTVGPTGPTYPSKFYFDLTATTSVAQPGMTVTFSVRVWDTDGNMVEGMEVIMSGSGVGLPSSGTTTQTSTSTATNSSGICNASFKIGDTAGGTISYITAIVEDMSLTIPVQVIATTL